MSEETLKSQQAKRDAGEVVTARKQVTFIIDLNEDADETEFLTTARTQMLEISSVEGIVNAEIEDVDVDEDDEDDESQD